jgi:hypothetical protein
MDERERERDRLDGKLTKVMGDMASGVLLGWVYHSMYVLEHL